MVMNVTASSIYRLVIYHVIYFQCWAVHIFWPISNTYFLITITNNYGFITIEKNI